MLEMKKLAVVDSPHEKVEVFNYRNKLGGRTGSERYRDGDGRDFEFRGNHADKNY